MVTYPAVRGEVYVSDFLGIETLRMFSPDSYDVVRANPERFLYTAGRLEGDDQNAERAFHEAWLKDVSEGATAVRAILSTLFPRWASLFVNYGGSAPQKWRRSFRICSEEVFPTYFRLAPPSGGVSAAEIRHVIALAPDTNAFGDQLARLALQRGPSGDTRAGAMVRRLLDHVDDIPAAAIPSVVNALFDVGDRLIAADTRDRGLLDLSDDWRISFLLSALLQRVPADKRKKVLHEAIASGRALVTMANEIGMFGRQIGRRGAERTSNEEPVLTSEVEVELLEEAVAIRIVRMQPLEAIWDSPKPQTLLEAVRLWVNPESARELVMKRIVSDDALLSFLDVFKNRVYQAPLGGSTRVVTTFDPMRLWPWVDDVEAVERRLGALDASGLTVDQKALVRAFAVGCAARREAKDPTSLL